MAQSFGITVVGVTLMMVLALRSVRLGLLAMVPNLFPVLVAVGGMGWVGVRRPPRCARGRARPREVRCRSGRRSVMAGAMAGGPSGATLVVLAAVGATALLAAVIFNRLVRARVRTEEAWSAIDVQLRRRADLVPRLVEVVRGYAAHEQAVFDRIARARSALVAASDPPAAAGANAEVTRTLAPMLGVVEAYPELRASEGFLRLQDELSDVEEKIAYARHFYNRNVERYNARLRSLPDVVVAVVMGLEPFAFFSAEGESTDG